MSSTVRSKPSRNAKIALICGLAFFGMVGAAYASVPLYRVFCQVTGFGGTVRKAEAAPSQTLGKTISIRFDTNVRDLPWTFEAEESRQDARIGETKLAHFRVTNHSDKAITGRAVFNVTPDQAGAYFQKLQCFCFDDQTIGPGQTVDMPVLYFVDPEYATDFETRNQPEVTLSYTFFPSLSTKAAEGPKAKSQG